MFDRTLNQHTDGLELSASDCPAYFKALREERAIAAFDAQNDFRTREFAECYLYIVRDESGNLLYYEGTVQDITTRKKAQAALHLEQEKSDRLLLNVLPKPIAERLKQDQSIIADTFAEVTVLFADIVGFTQLSARVSPTELVSLLNDIFSEFDHLAEKHGLEKIQTIGDAYMVVGGLPMPRSDRAEAIAQMALDMQQAITEFSDTHKQDFRIRIGINSGPVVAGVIGIKKFIYDWETPLTPLAGHPTACQDAFRSRLQLIIYCRTSIS